MGDNNRHKGGTILLPCTCEHKVQDEMYGKGRRMHNISQADGKAYCTVCTPRALFCDKHSQIEPNPALGIRSMVPGRKMKSGKDIPNQSKPVIAKPGLKTVGTVTEVKR